MRKSSAGLGIGLILMSLFSCFPLAFVYSVLNNISQTSAWFEANGKKAEATIVEVIRIRTDYYNYRIEFLTEEEELIEAFLPAGTSHLVGNQVEIFYDPENPTNVNVTGTNLTGPYYALGFMVFVDSCLGLLGLRYLIPPIATSTKLNLSR